MHLCALYGNLNIEEIFYLKSSYSSWNRVLLHLVKNDNKRVIAAGPPKEIIGYNEEITHNNANVVGQKKWALYNLTPL